MKEQTMTAIDPELKRKAKEANLNLSAELEIAIERKLNVKEVLIATENGEKCHDCGREGEKETVKTLKLNRPDALTWLYPDEVWICNSCLSRRSRHII